MARPTSNHPTELEFEILKIIWRLGPSTVKEVREALLASRKLAHTSVITTMNIMKNKGYLVRKKKEKKFVYQTKITKDRTTKKMMRDLLDRVYEGSVSSAMLSLIDSTKVDANDLEQLQEYIQLKLKEDSK